ncbi:hypothetical protein CFP56_042205 [Quercus suber]|uniref:Uncharacterized protein n=1 Tax=Quercus suber TaxID=58331 RepID=A0AAW0MAG6_QUESU
MSNYLLLPGLSLHARSKPSYLKRSEAHCIVLGDSDLPATAEQRSNFVSFFLSSMKALDMTALLRHQSIGYQE